MKKKPSLLKHEHHDMSRLNENISSLEIDQESEKLSSYDIKIINYEEKMNSVFNNIVELIDSEAIYRELDGVNSSLKNTFADKIEKYRSMIEREIISIKTEMSNIYKRLTVEELAHNMKKSELLQSTASHDIILQKIAVLEDESSKVPLLYEWKK